MAAGVELGVADGGGQRGGLRPAAPALRRPHLPARVAEVLSQKYALPHLVTNFLKTFFNQQQTCGYLSIHKKKDKYARTMSVELQAQVEVW